MKKRGRKSGAELVTFPGRRQGVPPRPPSYLDFAAKRLWAEIVRSRPADFFSAADLPLLAEFVVTAAVLPKVTTLLEKGFNVALLEQRDKLIRLSLALARSLRLNVSSRTRPDSARLRDACDHAGQGPKPWEEEPDEQPDESPAR